jgi:prefoldin subunit 5
VTSLEDDKTGLEQQVSVLQTNAESLQTHVDSLEYERGSLETQVANLTTEVDNLEAEVIISYSSGYDDGYAQGADDIIQSGYYFIDPTYDEAIAFINSDETDENEYTPDYVCYDFTADFINNAAQAGYRCGFVYIEFTHSAHAVACFNTTDMGLIYIEPQSDEIIDLAVGQTYLNYVIVKMGIIW